MTTSNVPGNPYDKYHTRNPIARCLMDGFLRAFDDLVVRSGACGAYEAGCGEGHLSIRMARRGLRIAGSDVDLGVVDEAIQNARIAKVAITFGVCSVYDIDTSVAGNPDLVVCCEVLEHLEEPERALDVIARLGATYLLVSVPREPIWRILNIARGKYWSDLGNSPGHVQHWSTKSFLHFLGQWLEVVAVQRPFPWTMALCKFR